MQIPSFYNSMSATATQTVSSRLQQTPSRIQAADTFHFSGSGRPQTSAAPHFSGKSPHTQWPKAYSYRILSTNRVPNSPNNRETFKEYDDLDLREYIHEIDGRHYGLSPEAKEALDAAEKKDSNAVKKVKQKIKKQAEIVVMPAYDPYVPPPKSEGQILAEAGTLLHNTKLDAALRELYPR